MFYMNYLDQEYRLSQVSGKEYCATAKAVALSKKLNSMTTALKIALKHEDPKLARVIEGEALNLHRTYGDGGGMYMLTSATSIKALRSNNPDIPQITPDDWDKVVDREQKLTIRPVNATLELIGGIGLAEVRDVNPGYVDGFQASFQIPSFMAASGVISLAALHAHDLMHFASQD